MEGKEHEPRASLSRKIPHPVGSYLGKEASDQLRVPDPALLFIGCLFSRLSSVFSSIQKTHCKASNLLELNFKQSRASLACND